MSATINAKQLRASLPEVVARVRKGARVTVIYRSAPAFEIVPIDSPSPGAADLADDPLYRARAVGRSKDRKKSADHDDDLYPR